MDGDFGWGIDKEIGPTITLFVGHGGWDADRIAPNSEHHTTIPIAAHVDFVSLQSGRRRLLTLI